MSAVAPCSSAGCSIETVLLDESSQTIAGVEIRLKNSAGQVVRNRTDSAGAVRFDVAKTEQIQLTLPALDHRAWELVRAENLAAATAKAPRARILFMSMSSSKSSPPGPR